ETYIYHNILFFFFQAEDGIRDRNVTGVQTCALPIFRIPLISNQPQYSMLWRVIEERVVPTSEKLGVGQIVWSPIAQGVLTGKYKIGRASCREREEVSKEAEEWNNNKIEKITI